MKSAKILPSLFVNSEEDIPNVLSCLKEYKSLSSSTAQIFLSKKSKQKQSCVPWSHMVFSTVALLDISGFTKLASALRVEELKYHINHFFSRLISQINKYNGDVVKFCGDCLMVIWPCSKSIDDVSKRSMIIRSIHCILELLDTCGLYQEQVGNTTVTLKLHCALSAGDLHCFCLGNESRMEFLIAGEQFKPLSTAEGFATAGQLCLAPGAHDLVRHLVTGTLVSPCGVFLVESVSGFGHGSSSYSLAGGSAVPSDSPGGKKRSLVQIGNSFPKRRRHSGGGGGMLGLDNDSTTSASGSSESFPQSPSFFSLLRHQTSWRRHSGEKSPSQASESSTESRSPAHHNSSGMSILSPSGVEVFPPLFSIADELSQQDKSGGERKFRNATFLRSSSTASSTVDTDLSQSEEYMKILERFVHDSARLAIIHHTTEHLSELRHVVTLFMHLTNLDCEFNSGQIERPQSAMLIVLEAMQTLGGTLRQYVVDDKGCVVICCFGVPGFSSQQDELKALYSAFCIRQRLGEEDIHCRIGIAKGMAYCGYVGSEDRKEYCMMGSSVNLAARLMAKCDTDQIIVNGGVYLQANSDFTFEKMPKIHAKGYNTAVHVYGAQQLRQGSNVPMTLKLAVEKLTHAAHAMGSCFVGRRKEMRALQETFSRLFDDFEIRRNSTLRAGLDTQMDDKEVSVDFAYTSLTCLSEETVSQSKLFKLPSTKDSSAWNPITSDKSSTSLAALPLDSSPLRGHVHRRNASIEPIPFAASLCTNKYLITGMEGSGKSAFISEFADRNKLALQYKHAVTCHLSNILEPYETARQLLKQVFIKPVSGGSGVRSSLSASRASFTSDMGAWLNAPKSSLDKNDDGYLFDDSVKYESVYDDIALWVEDHMANVWIDVGKLRSVGRHCKFFSQLTGLSSGTTSGATTKESESVEFDDAEEAPEDRCAVVVCAAETIGSAVQKKSSSASSVGEGSVMSVPHLLPLLRIVLDTRTRPSIDIIRAITEAKLEAAVEAVVIEIISKYITCNPVGMFVFENIQWADHLSFEIIRKILQKHDTSVLFLCTYRTAASFGRRFSYLRGESFEGGVVLNSMEEMSEYCHVLELTFLTKAEVKLLLESELGPDVIASTPNIISESSVQAIYSKSEHGLPSLVTHLIRDLKSSVLVKTFDAHTGEQAVYTSISDKGMLKRLDELSYESQVVIKTASVCGANFTRDLLRNTLERLGHEKTICMRIDACLSEIEESGLIRRVLGAEYAVDGSFAPTTLRARNTVEGSRTFSFAEKNAMDSIYAVMLEDQRRQVHAIVAALIEEAGLTSVDGMSCNTIELLAFHYSRTENIELEIKYVTLAAAKTHQENMFSVAFNYYHHLFLLATSQRTAEQVYMEACHVLKAPSLFGVTQRNIFAIPGASSLTRQYHITSAFSTPVRSRCGSITDDVFSDIIAEMSCVKYKQCEFIESYNLLLLSLHVRGISLSAAKTSRHLSSLPTADRASFGKHLFLQAKSCLIRGHVSEAEDMLKLAMPLLETVQSDLLQSGCALYATVLLFQNKPKDAAKWHSRATAVSTCNQKDTRSPFFSHVVLHFAIRLIVQSEFSTALSFLSNAMTKQLVHHDYGPLKFVIWSLMSWVNFSMGRLNETDTMLQTLSKRDKEHPVMRLWATEYNIVTLILRGDLNRSRKYLLQLNTLQAGHKGCVFYSALKGIVAACDKDHLSFDSDTRDECINGLIFACQKLSQHHSAQVLPIAIVCLFLATHCTIAIYSQIDRIIAVRRGGGLAFRLKTVSENAIKALSRTAQVVPFIDLLCESLQMKFDVAMHKVSHGAKAKKRCDAFRTSEHIVSSINSKASVSNEPASQQFIFGLAFWFTARSHYCAYFSEFGDSLAAEAETAQALSQDLLQAFRIPKEYFLVDDLIEKSKSYSFF